MGAGHLEKQPPAQAAGLGGVNTCATAIFRVV